MMIIGEGPGAKEDKTGEPFVGNAGNYLNHVLKGTGYTRDDFFITNIVKCRPPGNRAPRASEIDTCTSLYLLRQIEILQPKLVLLLGSTAVKHVLGAANVEQARGQVHERGQTRYLASYHPASRFYREDLAAKIKADFARLREELERLS